MKVSYFAETDTLYIEIRSADVDQTRDLDENTLLDLDAEGSIVAITLERASSRADIDTVTLSGIAA